MPAVLATTKSAIEGASGRLPFARLEPISVCIWGRSHIEDGVRATYAQGLEVADRNRLRDLLPSTLVPLRIKATTLESQLIHLIQELSGRTRKVIFRNLRAMTIVGRK
jgi:hypothetical protein